ncbi:thiamine phosphate synthase [Paenibacillus illinoisensis]|uniref:thiamine phosphate synthase n=1 Tax=Paenibacillus illinoisensis TaxID=59845 RepID=UPI001C8D75FE|nr:thiamine phosphate synthase [Paenibacillus illinoisensis]
MNSLSFELHAVSPGIGDEQCFVKTATDVWPWLDYIHIREKHLTTKQKIQWAYSLLYAGIPADRIVINGLCELNELEKHVFFQRVHWGQSNMATIQGSSLMKSDRLRLGVSVHSLHEARVAEERGADYLFYGHVFSSSSKPGSKPRGLSALSEICSAVSDPVIAIGGIGPANIAAVRAAGASGAAVISSIWTSDNPQRAAAALRQALER